VAEPGIANLVAADRAKESARHQSVHITQQLGAQALSIATQAPALVHSYFRYPRTGPAAEAAGPTGLGIHP
jgi:hypothetical protein